MNNGEGQSPCFLSAPLIVACWPELSLFPFFLLTAQYLITSPDGLIYPLAPIIAGHTYGPIGTDNFDANVCSCSNVYYNVVEACAACQNGEVGSWANWINGCANYPVIKGTFPYKLQSNSSIPDWALLDTTSGSFNVSQAKVEASKGLPDLYPTSAMTTTPTALPSSTSAAATSATSTSDQRTTHSDVGPIVGGTVGGVAGVVVLWLIVYAILRGKKQRASARRNTSRDMVTYDPRNPATFPEANGTRMGYTVYSGAPEV